MKKHFIKIFWEDDSRVTISPSKLFRALFGFDFPGGNISWG